MFAGHDRTLLPPRPPANPLQSLAAPRPIFDFMDNLVILSEREQEHLVRVIESAIYVRKRHQFFLWAQGQLQSLLPHDIMVCVQVSNSDETVHVECLHSVPLEAAVLDHLCNSRDGLAVRLAQYCRFRNHLPCIVEQGTRDATHPLHCFAVELEKHHLRNAIVHGTDRLRGGASFFVLFAMPENPASRHSYFLELMLPHLQMALLRVMASVSDDSLSSQIDVPKLVTDREVEVLRWVKEGKSNHEIGAILGISPLTVKNHVQKIYRKLNVQNRAQAVSRGISLRLLDFNT